MFSDRPQRTSGTNRTQGVFDASGGGSPAPVRKEKKKAHRGLVWVLVLVAGAAIAAVGMLSFVGLIVPHIARLLVGSDYRYLFPASIFLGFSLIVICDTIGRVIMPPGEVPVSIIISFIGAPFFLFLLRSRGKDGN